ncbi:MAG: ABC transporter ATP-binding protein [Bacilli bacterium]
MIELINVNKIYGSGENSVHAIKDVNLVIEDGKFTAIIGKSGSGKSTLMNLIGGLDVPTSGKVIASGVELNSLSENQLADYRNKQTGFIFQSFYLEPTFSVLDNVAMPLIISGVNKKTREKKAKEILSKLGLLDKMHKKANELSGGQKQRVSIARALIHDPKIILADEPTGNLDSQNGAEVMQILKSICEGGTSVVLVTHNMEDAINADKLIVIKDGCIFTDEQTILEHQPILKIRQQYEN